MPTAYLEDVELTPRLAPDVAERATPGQVLMAIESASEIADGYLGKIYALPLTSFDDKALKKRVADIAEYDLVDLLDVHRHPVRESAVYLNYMDAIAWFEALVAGSITIDVTDTGGATTAATAPRVNTGTSRGW